VALASRPELLILDDPALGLDALARRDLLWTTLDVAREEGTTVLFTSHVLQDVERIVDEVLLLDRGTVRVHGPLEDVLARTRRLVFPRAAAGPRAVAGEIGRARHGEDVVVVTGAFSPGLLAELSREHPEVMAEPMNLEQIFCEVVAGQNGGAEKQA
jgi:ABC-2 type transport system ATP-binding protein